MSWFNEYVMTNWLKVPSYFPNTVTQTSGPPTEKLFWLHLSSWYRWQGVFFFLFFSFAWHIKRKKVAAVVMEMGVWPHHWNSWVHWERCRSVISLAAAVLRQLQRSQFSSVSVRCVCLYMWVWGVGRVWTRVKKQRQTIRKRKIGGRYCKTTAWDWYVCHLKLQGRVARHHGFSVTPKTNKQKTLGRVCVCVCVQVWEREWEILNLCEFHCGTHTHPLLQDGFPSQGNNDTVLREILRCSGSLWISWKTVRHIPNTPHHMSLVPGQI